MSQTAHTLAIVAVIVLAYIWVQVPMLQNFSTQIFAVLMLVFFIIKRFKKAKLWHILPDRASLEITVLTFAFLILIGSTGNTSSVFYPLGYLHLFFLVMACHVPTAIVATVTIMLFHYGVQPSFESYHIQTILSLPIMLILFLFAKHQYDEAQTKTQLLDEEDKQLAQLQQEVAALRSQVADSSSKSKQTNQGS